MIIPREEQEFRYRCALRALDKQLIEEENIPMEADEKLIATLTIHGISKLSAKQISNLMVWLDNQKETVIKDMDNLSDRYTAKLWRHKK